MSKADPQSGYDDTVWVVRREVYGDRTHTTLVAVYGDRDEAEEATEEEREKPFQSATIEPVGIHHADLGDSDEDTVEVDRKHLQRALIAAKGYTDKSRAAKRSCRLLHDKL